MVYRVKHANFFAHSLEIKLKVNKRSYSVSSICTRSSSAYGICACIREHAPLSGWETGSKQCKFSHRHEFPTNARTHHPHRLTIRDAIPSICVCCDLSSIHGIGSSEHARTHAARRSRRQCIYIYIYAMVRYYVRVVYYTSRSGALPEKLSSTT